MARTPLSALLDEELVSVRPEMDREDVRQQRKLGIVGSPSTVRARIEAMAADTGADEVMIVTNIHGHAERLKSYELLTDAFAEQRKAA